MGHRTKLAHLTGLSALRILLTTSALAATTPCWGQEAQQAAGSSGEPVDDIVVTATRRSESLQDVPISVQALGEQVLDQQQVASFDDYAKLLPSVSFQSFGPSQSRLFFRGISSGGDGLDAGSLPTTGVYVDEIPITTIGATPDLHIYDISRVEALAGPQGTLFGASSLSGTLRIITNKPSTSSFEGGYDVQLNKFGKGDAGGSLEAFVNVPVSEDIAFRLVGYYQKDGGYIDNTYAERTFTLDDGDPTTNLTVNNADTVKKNFNDVESYGGRAALKIDLDENWTVSPTLIYQRQKTNGSFIYDPRVGDLKVHDFQDSFNLDRWYQAALTIEGKIGNFDLVYSGGYFERKIDNEADYSYYTVAYDSYGYFATYFPDGKGGFLNPTQRQIVSYDFTKHTQEFRISSPSTDRFRVTTGLFYQRQTNAIDSRYQIPGIGSVPQENLIWFNAIPGFGDTVYLKKLDRVDRDYAVFGEASFDITPSLTITGGIRGFKARNTLYGFSEYSYNIPGRCVAPSTTLPCITTDKQIKESGETHKINLTWKVDRDKMVYATYSTGFRPGGVNRRPDLGEFKSDSLSNFEIGWKTSWLDRRLRINGAVFHERWNDMQFGLSRPGDNGVYSISNVGKATSTGIEGDVVFRLGGLQLSASGTYVDAKIKTDFCQQSSGGAIACTPSGTRLPVQPRFKGNATARYSFPLSSSNAFLQAAAFHQGGTRSFLLDSEVDVVGYTKGFTTFDFSAGTSFHDLSIELYIQNAFDKRGELSRNSFCAPVYCGQYYRVYPVKPQIFGVKVGQRF